VEAEERSPRLFRVRDWSLEYLQNRSAHGSIAHRGALSDWHRGARSSVPYGWLTWSPAQSALSTRERWMPFVNGARVLSVGTPSGPFARTGGCK